MKFFNFKGISLHIKSLKVKKLISGLAFLLISANLASGLPLKPEEALKRISDNQNCKVNIKDFTYRDLKMTRYVGDQPVMYIFSKGDDSGLVILSAEDNSPILLGYTEKGNFNGKETELPDNMVYWLNTMGEQLASNRNGKFYDNKETREEIEPLLTTKWDQGYPYNNSCPSFNGEHSYTGCVATAMAQTLKYFNYPTKGFGQHSYALNNSLISFDYGNTTFDWANMTDTYGPQSRAVEINAVATLMYACGVGVDMKYTSMGSGAFFFNAVRALTENFGYDKGLRYLERNYYYSSEWDELLYNSLKNYGPVIYGGNDGSLGHAFVCDGYKDGYYHFNWGWGGLSDGYFLLTAMNPDSEGIGGSGAGYNFNQHMITHLKTEQTSEHSFEQMLGQGNFTIYGSSAKPGDRVRATATFYSFSSGILPAPEIGWEITDETSGDSMFIGSVTFWDIPPTYGFQDADLTIKLPENLKSGMYIVRPAFRCSEGLNSVIPIRMPLTNIGEYKMSVSEGNVTFLPADKAVISFSDIDIETDLYISYPFKVNAKVSNSDNSLEYFGEIYLTAFHDGNVVAVSDPILIDLLAGETKDMEIISHLSKSTTSTLSKAEICDIAFCTQEGDNNFIPVSNLFKATVHPAPITRIQASDLNISVGEDKNISADAEIFCKDGYFAGYLPLYIYEGEATSYLDYYNSDFFAVSANESENAIPERSRISFQFKFDKGEFGKQYRGGIFYKGSWLTDFVDFKLEEQSGVEELSADKDSIISKEYYTVTGLCIGHKPLMPGIYIIIEKHANGRVTSKREIFRPN